MPVSERIVCARVAIVIEPMYAQLQLLSITFVPRANGLSNLCIYE